VSTGLTQMKDWSAALKEFKDRLVPGDPRRRSFAEADIDMVQRAVRGLGPDSAATELPSGGVRVVFNLSSAHVPDFCQDGYRNAYDLGRYVVGEIQDENPPRRVQVDLAIGGFFKLEPNEIYFGAAELNGSGVRFYGDVCLVLNPRPSPNMTALLDRNSYDLLRAPIYESFTKAQAQGGTDAVVMDYGGRWDDALCPIVAIKVLEGRVAANRRITTGYVSEGVLADEDYVEVLRKGSFVCEDLEGARTTTADAARESFIGSRERSGQPISLAELNWREVRQGARAALDQAGVAMRVVISSGRIR
jgi:hypothetical protein